MRLTLMLLLVTLIAGSVAAVWMNLDSLVAFAQSIYEPALESITRWGAAAWDFIEEIPRWFEKFVDDFVN
jgi:hypothetical protein